MLLAQAENEDANLSDADMLASMMTAIRSFVNDWVASDKEHQELGEIEYGGNKIIIEASGSSYLAVIVEGAAYTKTYDKIRHSLEQIVLTFGDDIKEFQGDFNNFPKEEIEKKLQELLLRDESDEGKKETKKRHPLLYILPLLLTLFFVYKTYENYIDEKLQEEIAHKITTTPALSAFAITVDVEDKHANLKGRVPFEYHKELAYKEAKKIQGLKDITNNIEVIPTLTDPMQVSAQIAYLIKGMNLATANNVSYTFDYQNLHLFGTMDSIKQKEALLHELHSIQGIKKIEDDIIVTPLNINTNLYFEKASKELSATAKKELLSLVQKLQKREQKPTLILNAYSDMIGSQATNKALAQKRIDNIIAFLHAYIPSLAIESHIYHTPPPGVDPKKDPDLARCVTLMNKKEE